MQGIRVTHEQFGYEDGTPGSRADEVYTSLQSGSENEDCNGHGTHVAGTVGGLTFGPAKNVSLHAVRSLECLGNGTVSQVGCPAAWSVPVRMRDSCCCTVPGRVTLGEQDQASSKQWLVGCKGQLEQPCVPHRLCCQTASAGP